MLFAWVSIYKFSRTEPTGTTLADCGTSRDKLFHGTIFFPRWVANSPEKTVSSRTITFH